VYKNVPIFGSPCRKIRMLHRVGPLELEHVCGMAKFPAHHILAPLRLPLTYRWSSRSGRSRRRICRPSVVRDNRSGLIMHAQLWCLVLFIFFIFYHSHFQKWKTASEMTKTMFYIHISEYLMINWPEQFILSVNQKKLKEKFIEYWNLPLWHIEADFTTLHLASGLRLESSGT